ncbi:MAG: hypothetical protein O2782_17510 [bacterium]|nr:hypothetical protein [bacterium]
MILAILGGDEVNLRGSESAKMGGAPVEHDLHPDTRYPAARWDFVLVSADPYG